MKILVGFLIYYWIGLAWNTALHYFIYKMDIEESVYIYVGVKYLLHLLSSDDMSKRLTGILFVMSIMLRNVIWLPRTVATIVYYSFKKIAEKVEQ